MKTLKELFKSKKLYIFLIVFFFLLNYIFDGTVFSFGWFSVWTEEQNLKMGKDYVKTSSLDDTVVGTTLANIKLGGKGFVGDDLFVFSESVDYFQKSEDLLQTDILKLIEGNVHKDTVLGSYLSQLETNLENIKDMREDLLTKIGNKESSMQNCVDKKERGDGMFFRGIENNDSQIMRDGFEISLENGPCVARNRIAKNAYAALRDKADNYIPLIEKKYSLLRNNKDLILNNSEMFRNNFLERLISIKERLRNYQSEYQNIGG